MGICVRCSSYLTSVSCPPSLVSVLLPSAVLFARRYQQALEQFNTAIELSPGEPYLIALVQRAQTNFRCEVGRTRLPTRLLAVGAECWPGFRLVKILPPLPLPLPLPLQRQRQRRVSHVPRAEFVD